MPAPAPTPAPAPASAPAPAPASDPHALPPARRADLSASLETAARKALSAREIGVAIPLYRGVVAARGPGAAAAAELARAWTIAGDYEAAIDVLDELIAAGGDADRIAAARAERARLAAARSPLSGGVKLTPPRAVARDHFKRGRAAFAAGDYKLALFHHRVGLAVDPDLPGFLRELAASYARLGDRAAMREHYLAYLRRRPVGKFAGAARQAVAGDDRLGTLAITSSLPCDEVWLRGERLSRALPVKSLAVPAGSYRGLCVSYKFEIAYFERVDVVAGEPATLAFRWAIVENRLENPMGRIAVEDPRRPGVMMDLGITTPAVGVVVPAAKRPLRLRLRSDDGSRERTRSMVIEPGARVVVRW
jgi:tetratricopeptide (TPR) repeat protein